MEYRKIPKEYLDKLDDPMTTDSYWFIQIALKHPDLSMIYKSHDKFEPFAQRGENYWTLIKTTVHRALCLNGAPKPVLLLESNKSGLVLIIAEIIAGGIGQGLAVAIPIACYVIKIGLPVFCTPKRLS